MPPSRRSYLRLSADLESFFALRSQFITGYSTICVAQYILGIGDRHLSNLLIDLRNGSAIGIDFGMAFGFSTIHLPVPELMPFRLTRSITEITEPIGWQGSMQATMEHVLRALRDQPELLLAIMEVFIKEPSVDWLGNAERISSRDFASEQPQPAAPAGSGRALGVTYAIERVQNTRRKLQGINPCAITKIDLEADKELRGKYLSSMTDVVTGDRTRNIRARLYHEKGAECPLTVQEQVLCLIDQATDPNILGRVYYGWEPFV